MSRSILKVFRSNKHIYTAILDPQTKEVQISFSDQKLTGSKTERAKLLGELTAKQLKERKITEVVFDRSGYQYHGRVKAIAEAIRANGVTI